MVEISKLEYSFRNETREDRAGSQWAFRASSERFHPTEALGQRPLNAGSLLLSKLGCKSMHWVTANMFAFMKWIEQIRKHQCIAVSKGFCETHFFSSIKSILVIHGSYILCTEYLEGLWKQWLSQCGSIAPKGNTGFGACEPVGMSLMNRPIRKLVSCVFLFNDTLFNIYCWSINTELMASSPIAHACTKFI